MSAGDNESSQFQSILLSELQNLRSDVSSLRNDLHGEVTSLRETIAHLKAAERQQDRQLNGFRSDVWNPLQNDLSDIHAQLNNMSERLRSVENSLRDVDHYRNTTEDLSETVSSLEKKSLKRQGMAAGLGVAGGGGFAALIRYILSAIG